MVEAYSIASVATTGLDAASSAAWPIIWTAVLIVFLVFGWWMLQYRHKVRVRILTNHGHVPFDDRAREIMVDNAPFWKLRKRKDVFPAPPRETRDSLGKDILGKPKYYHETYFSDEYGYIPIHDEVSKDNIVTHMKNGMVENTFKPLTPTQRALYTSQLRKAQSRKSKTLLDQISQFATPMMLVMIILMGLMFWEDIAKPAKDIAGTAAGMVETNAEYARTNAEIAAQNARLTQVLAGKLEAEELRIAQNIPQDGSVS